MASFANQDAFSDPRSRLLALGQDLNAANAITDAKGNVLAYVQTGGMLSPLRRELMPGETIFRFGRSGMPIHAVVAGGWWVEQREFETLVAFANVHDLALPMAVRLLCLVPPEWSDLGLLVRCRIARPLLAWRGLANSVIVRKSDNLGSVSLPATNEIAARRLHQLFVPGLGQAGRDALSIAASWPFSSTDGMRGWLYL